MFADGVALPLVFLNLASSSVQTLAQTFPGER